MGRESKVPEAYANHSNETSGWCSYTTKKKTTGQEVARKRDRRGERKSAQYFEPLGKSNVCTAPVPDSIRPQVELTQAGERFKPLDGSHTVLGHEHLSSQAEKRNK